MACQAVGFEPTTQEDVLPTNPQGLVADHGICGTLVGLKLTSDPSYSNIIRQLVSWSNLLLLVPGL